MLIEQILKAEFKDRFRNVSRIMDCVGCDKCRLWGKVQITGLAAAMKILFEMDDKALEYASRSPFNDTELSRRSQPTAEPKPIVSMGGCSFAKCPLPIQREFARDRRLQANMERAQSHRSAISGCWCFARS